MICSHCKQDAIQTVAQLRSHWVGCYGRDDWKKVTELRRAGDDDQADKLVRKILGIKGPEMPEHIKEQLRQYQREHREEQYARKKLKRLERRLAKRRLQGSARLVRAR